MLCIFSHNKKCLKKEILGKTSNSKKAYINLEIHSGYIF